MNEKASEHIEGLSVDGIERSFIERTALQKEVLITQRFSLLLQEWIGQNLDHLS